MVINWLVVVSEILKDLVILFKMLDKIYLEVLIKKLMIVKI